MLKKLVGIYKRVFRKSSNLLTSRLIVFRKVTGPFEFLRKGSRATFFSQPLDHFIPKGNVLIEMNYLTQRGGRPINKTFCQNNYLFNPSIALL